MANTSSQPNLRKLKDLSRLMPVGEDMERAGKDMVNGSDHASALIPIAWIDHMLKSFIKMKFKNDLTASEESLMFDNSGPMSNLWSKVQFLYSSGNMGIATRDSVLKLNNIRNAFAHATELVSFETPEIALSCNDLIVQDEFVDFLVSGNKTLSISPAKNRFLLCSLCTMGGITLGVIRQSEISVRIRPDSLERTKALDALDKFFKNLGNIQILP